MLSSLRPALEHLATYQAIPKRMLSELLRGFWERPDDNLQALLDHHLTQLAEGTTGAYVLGRKGKKLLGYKRLDYEPSRDSVRLAVLKQHVIALLAYGNYQLDESDRLVYKGDLAFTTPEGGRAYVRCTLKDMSVRDLKLMIDRYVHNPVIATEKVVITARRPEEYRTLLENEFLLMRAVRLIPSSIYDYLDA